MYAVLRTIKVKPGHLEEFIDHLRRHAQTSATEAGCLCFDVLQDQNDPQTICLYEVFRSEADLTTHHAQDYYRRWMDLSRDWREPGGSTRRVLNRLHPGNHDRTD